METDGPRLPERVGTKLQFLSQLLELFRLRSQTDPGGEVSDAGQKGDQDTDEQTRGFIKVPEPSRIFGSYAGRIVMNPNPPTEPTEAEVRNQGLLDAAAAIKDPWAGPTPPLYSSRSRKK